LAGTFTCPARDIDAGVWQDHLVRHPLGIHGKVQANGPAPWDLEAWDQTDPPVINAKRRNQLLTAIAALAQAGGTCLVPEIIGGPRGVVEPDAPACSRCLPLVRSACVNLCHEQDPVGLRYAEHTEQCLAAVEGEQGIIVARTALVTALLRTRNSPEADATLVVLSFGHANAANTRIARLNRGDGTRVELYVDAGRTLRWRTTYRQASRRGDTRAPLLAPRRQFLVDFPMESSTFGTLSDKCVVPRLWWRTHAS
jgi:hypothetical protein